MTVVTFRLSVILLDASNYRLKLYNFRITHIFKHNCNQQEHENQKWTYLQIQSILTLKMVWLLSNRVQSRQKKWCALCLSRCLTMLCRTAANVFSWRQLVDFYIQTCYNSYRPSNRQWSPLLRENRSHSLERSRHGQWQTLSTGLRHVSFLLWRKVPESEAWNGSVMAILM